MDGTEHPAVESPADSEFALIDRIIARLGEAAACDILIPPGDDAAAWIPAGGAVVATTDAMTEGTHWRPHLMTMEDVGWRAVASTVSDLAAMGATPQVLLVVATLGPSMSVPEMDSFIDGMSAACSEHQVQVAGGDIIRGRSTTFAITALGAARLDRASRAIVMRRDAAQPGDVVGVSGTPGAAAAGFRLLERGARGEAADGAIDAFLRPRARTELGLAAVAIGVHCGMDISDGLVQDMRHIAGRSGVGIEVDLDALPLHPAAIAAFGLDTAREIALGGGEDYELILVGRQAAMETLEGVTVIGRVLEAHPGDIVVRQGDGAPYPLPTGWDQLRAWPLAR